MSKPAIAVIALVAVAVLFGGGGSKYPLANLTVQLAALTVMAALAGSFASGWKALPRTLAVLIVLSLLLPLLQAVPLPPPAWTLLPAREAVEQSHVLTGGTAWMPLSIDPHRTLIAASALLVPLAILVPGWSLRQSDLITLGWAVAALGLVNVGWGTLQVLSNGEQALLYPEIEMPGVLFGTFANRNSTGLFLVACLALALLLPLPTRLARASLFVRLVLGALLIVGVLLTRSRTSSVLALIPVSLYAVRLGHVWWSKPREKERRGRGIAIALSAAALFAVLAAGLAFAAPGRIGDLAARFATDRVDARAYIWDDATYSADKYWPAGSGMGTFDEVFQLDESLENLTQRRAGRAHNDYIEIVIEAGFAGAALVLAWLVFIAWASWYARRAPGRWIAWSGSAILLAIALQSITDYPLRNLAMFAGAAVGLLLLTRFGFERLEATR
ncbi:O-antigen ligase family protein [Erythrobacter sp.]|uniref:O-antigen ligase family protein n=1 Tax=Erythrobacter sp. TaxID=1042 RepID=UPI002EAE434B|nr:O-antigen ligase family protein [Erythrobacter sp.]